MTVEAIMAKEGRIYQLLEMPAKEREIRVGDQVRFWLAGGLKQGEITRVTKKYIWLSWRYSSSSKVHFSRRYREIALLYSKFY